MSETQLGPATADPNGGNVPGQDADGAEPWLSARNSFLAQFQGSGPGERIWIALRLREAAEDALHQAVIDARLEGWTWARVGRALGQDPSGACARYGRESRQAIARRKQREAWAEAREARSS